MRKVHVKVIVDVFVLADENVDIGDVINEMDYSFVSQTDGANIQDTEIKDFTITDSR